MLWARDPAQASALQVSRLNERYLPEVPLPGALAVTDDARDALGGAALALVATPVSGLRDTLALLHRNAPGVPAVWLCKGFEKDAARLPHEVEGSNRWYRAVLREGRNREVRKLVEAVGRRVSRLVRVRYGTETLGRGLEPGAWRELDARAISTLSGIAAEGKIR